MATRLDRCYANTECFHWVEKFELVNSRQYGFDHHYLQVRLDPPIAPADRRPDPLLRMRPEILQTDEYLESMEAFLV